MSIMRCLALKSSKKPLKSAENRIIGVKSRRLVNFSQPYNLQRD